jgi:hypothetical protein
MTTWTNTEKGRVEVRGIRCYSDTARSFSPSTADLTHMDDGHAVLCDHQGHYAKSRRKFKNLTAAQAYLFNI